jgi:hypothetical protein
MWCELACEGAGAAAYNAACSCINMSPQRGLSEAKYAISGETGMGFALLDPSPEAQSYEACTAA